MESYHGTLSDELINCACPMALKCHFMVLLSLPTVANFYDQHLVILQRSMWLHDHVQLYREIKTVQSYLIARNNSIVLVYFKNLP